MIDTLKVKRALARPFGLRMARTPRDTILLYHAVGEGPSAVSVETFSKQIEWLRNATDVVSLDQLLDGRRSQSRRVAITFDDGYDCVFRNAFPIMRNLGCVGTVYVNTGWIGEDAARASEATLGHYEGEHFMAWSSVIQLAQAGWTIGSHGVEHVDLTKVNDVRMRHELCASKNDIESQLGRSCEHFAFTWGHFSVREQMGVRDAGYRTAASAFHGAFDAGNDLYALPRVDVASRYTVSDLEAIVRGDWDFMGGIQRVRARLRERG